MFKLADALSRMIRAGKLSDRALTTLGVQKYKPQTILDRIKNTIANAPGFLQRFIPSGFRVNPPKLSDQYKAIMDNGAYLRSQIQSNPFFSNDFLNSSNKVIRRIKAKQQLRETFDTGIREWKNSVANAPKLKNPEPRYSTNPQYDWRESLTDAEGPMTPHRRRPLKVMHPNPEDYNPFFNETTLKATNLLPRRMWGEGEIWLNLPGFIKGKGFHTRYGRFAAIREALIPDLKMLHKKTKNFSPELQEKILDTAKATIRHELGHDKANQLTAEQAQRLMDIIHKKLGRTYENQPLVPGRLAQNMLNETLAQWFATRGKNRAAKAAINFPITAAMEKNPKLFAEWEQALQGLPENLKRRLLAIRSHNFVNYRMQ